MRYDSCQFGPFDSPDNRKAIFRCFERMGRNLPECEGGLRRAAFLQGMLDLSRNGFAGKPLTIEGLPSAGEAYDLFVALVTGMMIPIEKAALVLEEAVRYLERQEYAAPLEVGWRQ